jgi:hypothetical protein
LTPIIATAAHIRGRIQSPKPEVTRARIDPVTLFLCQIGALSLRIAFENLLLERDEVFPHEPRNKLLQHPVLFDEFEMHEKLPPA